MKYIIVILVFLFNLNSTLAQNKAFKKPNYKKIKREVAKNKSDFYYPKLFKKFSSVSSNLTIEEKRFLYYGYIYQKKYSPFGFSKYSDSLNTNARKPLTKETLKKMLFFSERILSKNPFNLKVLTYKAYLDRKNKDDVGYAITKKQINIIFDAIKSTGNGRSKETAFHIIFRDHKHDLLKHFKLKYNGIHKTIDKYRIEYLNVVKNKKRIRGVYFNVSAFKINLKSKR